MKPKITKSSAVTTIAKARSNHLERAAVSPSTNGAVVIDTFGEALFGKLDFNEVAALLRADLQALKANDLSHCEAMLFMQAHALQTIFTNLARRACKQEQLPNYEAFMRLALKTQSQCRATLETLAGIKNPTSVAFVRQANIAHNQQVNNNPTAASPMNPSASAHAHGNSGFTPNELSKPSHEQAQSLNAGTTSGTSQTHPAMAAVEVLHRP